MTQPDAFMPPAVPARASAPRRRCARHEEREAVARCTACGGGFCRECVTEHEDRIYCGPCFAKHVAGEQKRARHIPWSRMRGTALAAGSLFCLVLGFYLLGRVLAAIPSEFHDGTIWKETFGR